MTWTWRVLLAVMVASNGSGCSLWRNELKEERTSLDQRKTLVREYMDKSAPVGSRWAAHPDTERLLGDINRSDMRIREINRELGE